jgi:hypothetical protein
VLCGDDLTGNLSGACLPGGAPMDDDQFSTLQYESVGQPRPGLWRSVRIPAAWTMIVFGIAAALWGVVEVWINHDNPMTPWTDPLMLISLGVLVTGFVAFVVGMTVLHRRARSARPRRQS